MEKVKVVSHGNSLIQVFTAGTLNARQRETVKYLLRELPHYDEEVHEYKVEVHEKDPLVVNGKVLCTYKPTVFLFADTKAKDERGALILCRKHYLFTIGPRGGFEQLMPERKRKDLRRR